MKNIKYNSVEISLFLFVIVSVLSLLVTITDSGGDFKSVEWTVGALIKTGIVFIFTGFLFDIRAYLNKIANGISEINVRAENHKKKQPETK